MGSVQKDALLKRIQSIDNDELVAVLDEDISFFTGEKEVLDFISQEDREELIQMVGEPFGFDTETEEAFKKATERWRMN